MSINDFDRDYDLFDESEQPEDLTKYPPEYDVLAEIASESDEDKPMESTDKQSRRKKTVLSIIGVLLGVLVLIVGAAIVTHTAFPDTWDSIMTGMGIQPAPTEPITETETETVTKAESETETESESETETESEPEPPSKEAAVPTTGGSNGGSSGGSGKSGSGGSGGSGGGTAPTPAPTPAPAPEPAPAPAVNPIDPDDIVSSAIAKASSYGLIRDTTCGSWFGENSANYSGQYHTNDHISQMIANSLKYYMDTEGALYFNVDYYSLGGSEYMFRCYWG